MKVFLVFISYKGGQVTPISKGKGKTLVLTYVLGAQKNCLIEMVLLSTHKICFGWEIRKIIFSMHVVTTVNSEIFTRILFSRIALKDIFAMLLIPG